MNILIIITRFLYFLAGLIGAGLLGGANARDCSKEADPVKCELEKTQPTTLGGSFLAASIVAFLIDTVSTYSSY